MDEDKIANALYQIPYGELIDAIKGLKEPINDIGTADTDGIAENLAEVANELSYVVYNLETQNKIMGEAVESLQKLNRQMSDMLDIVNQTCINTGKFADGVDWGDFIQSKREELINEADERKLKNLKDSELIFHKSEQMFEELRRAIQELKDRNEKSKATTEE